VENVRAIPSSFGKGMNAQKDGKIHWKNREGREGQDVTLRSLGQKLMFSGGKSAAAGAAPTRFVVAQKGKGAN